VENVKVVLISGWIQGVALARYLSAALHSIPLASVHHDYKFGLFPPLCLNANVPQSKDKKLNWSSVTCVGEEEPADDNASQITDDCLRAPDSDTRSR